MLGYGRALPSRLHCRLTVYRREAANGTKKWWVVVRGRIDLATMLGRHGDLKLAGWKTTSNEICWLAVCPVAKVPVNIIQC